MGNNKAGGGEEKGEDQDGARDIWYRVDRVGGRRDDVAQEPESALLAEMVFDYTYVNDPWTGVLVRFWIPLGRAVAEVLT